MADTPAILAALATVRLEDLEEIDRRIAGLAAELEALKAARKICAARLGVKPLRAAKAPPPPSPADDALREKIFDLVQKNGQPMKPKAIAALIGDGTSPQKIGAVCRHEWFTRTAGNLIAIA